MNQSDTSYKLGAGFIGAIISYVLGLVLTFGLTKLDVDILSDGTIAQTIVQEIKFTGVFYHGAHFVQILAEVQTIDRSETQRFFLHEFLQQAGQITLPVALYYIIPFISLAVGTFVVVRLLDREHLTIVNNGKHALHIVPGYFILSMLGAFLFRVTQDAVVANITIGPSFLMTALMMGLLFPVVLSLLYSAVFYKIAEKIQD